MTVHAIRPPAPWPGLPARLMGPGDQGPAVATLQARLAALGYMAIAPDGRFGPSTTAAVRGFQRDHGLAADGLVGSRTRAALATASEGPAAPTARPLDDHVTWVGTASRAFRNFGHRPAADGAVVRPAAGGLAWADTGTRVTPDQWAAMPPAQQAKLLEVLAPDARAATAAALAGGDAARARGPRPRPRALSAREAPPAWSLAARDMQNLLATARAASAGKRPDGYCYMHVWRFIERSGYGHMPAVGIPDSHAAYAKQFAYYADANLARLGLRKLAIDNPYDAPAGAIVVVRPGTPGTSHPVAGDIAVADGRGRFYNGGEMGYGGRANFPPGNTYVMGVYVPAGND